MIIFILLLGLILRLILINQSLWLDEAAQVIESARPLSEQFNIQGDFQPPLFHLLLHFWMRLGTSESWMRLLTVIISVFSIYLFYKICLKLLDKKFALFSSLLMAINPYAIYYSQELRPYPLTVLLSLLIVWGYIKNSLFIVVLGMTLFLYTSYFAPFFIIALLICSIIEGRKKIKWLIRNTIISIIFFLPWIPKFYEQFITGTSLTTTLPGWGNAVSLPTIKAIPLVFAKFFLGRMTIDNKIIYGLIIIFLISIFFYLYYKIYSKKYFYFFTCLFFIPLISVALVNFVIPILDPKRILFILPLFIGIIAYGIFYLRKAQKILIVLYVVSSFIYGLFQYYTNPRFQREQWKQAVDFVETNGDGTQITLFAFPEPFAPYLWYEKKKIYSFGIAKNFVVRSTDIQYLKDIIPQRRRIFYFQYLSELTDPQSKIPKFLLENGFILTQTHDFPGVGFIYQYDKVPLALAS